MKFAKKMMTVAWGATLLLGMGMSTAYAATATTGGAKVVNGATWINVYDTANDGQFVSGNWWSTWGASGAIVNKNGFDKVVGDWVTSGGEKVRTIQACRSRTALPMTCGSKVSTGY